MVLFVYENKNDKKVGGNHVEEKEMALNTLLYLQERIEEIDIEAMRKIMDVEPTPMITEGEDEFRYLYEENIRGRFTEFLENSIAYYQKTDKQ